MNVDDLPAIFDVRASTVENAISIEQLESKHGITPASLTLEMQDKAAGWLCEADGQVVGFCMGDRSNGETPCWRCRPKPNGTESAPGCWRPPANGCSTRVMSKSG